MYYVWSNIILLEYDKILLDPLEYKDDPFRICCLNSLNILILFYHILIDLY
jgi:hypothetical protein